MKFKMPKMPKIKMPDVMGKAKELSAKVGSEVKSKTKGAASGIKKLNPLEDIFIGSSIFPFHQINNLYFFFEEHSIEEEKPMILKSILKDTNKKPIKHTKKVRIVLQPKKEIKNVRKNKLTKKRKTFIS